MTRNVAYLLSVALILYLGIGSTSAFAGIDDVVDAEDKQKTAYELQQQIEERQAAYATALAEVDEAAAEIAANEDRVAALERELPAQQRRSSTAARDLYKFQHDSLGLVDLLLSTDSFVDFITGLDYMNRASQASIDEICRLNDLKAEVDAAQTELKIAQTEAEMRAEDARVALMAAQEAQAEVQRRIEEEARAEAEIAAMAAAMAEQERDNDSGSPVVPETGTVQEPQIGTNPGSDSADAPSDTSGASEASGRAASDENAPSQPDPQGGSGPSEAPASNDYSGEDAYVAEWAARIDAYLAGSPLAGQGTTFARAAYTYGVDPRFSPAISFTESSKGLYCFLPHNAWGWGSASWGSWEEAIYDHVAGLARGYGGQISIEGAKKYCPPNWRLWYDRTLAQMQLI